MGGLIRRRYGLSVYLLPSTTIYPLALIIYSYFECRLRLELASSHGLELLIGDRSAQDPSEFMFPLWWNFRAAIILRASLTSWSTPQTPVLSPWTPRTILP